MALWENEEARQHAFPVAARQIFLAHAGVTALPRVVAQAMADYAWESSRQMQEFGEALKMMAATREVAARMVEGHADEVALLGPTSLGLSLFARGLTWQEGDEILCYHEDYPANVYPWLDLERVGVKVRYLRPDSPGAITAELVEAAITPRTRLVALASCHFLTGTRIDIEAIGRVIHRHGALFSLDAIQTVGAFPTPVQEVDFLSADAHKWMLGPMAMGIVYVKKAHFEKLHPILLGAANVRSPNFIAQEEIKLPERAARYEPGVLNMSGVVGMKAALELIQEVGLATISDRLLQLKARLVAGLKQLGYQIHGPESGPTASSITTCYHPEQPLPPKAEALERASIIASLRHDRNGKGYLRFSPHFYNTEAEIDWVLNVLGDVNLPSFDS